MRTSRGGWWKNVLRPHHQYVSKGKNTEPRRAYELYLDTDLFVFTASVPSDFITVDSGVVVVETELVVVNRVGTCAYADEISIILFLNLRRLGNQLLVVPSMAPPFHHSSGYRARTSSSFRSFPLLSTYADGTDGVSSRKPIDVGIEPKID
jgi:hypothetical protein